MAAGRNLTGGAARASSERKFFPRRKCAEPDVRLRYRSGLQVDYHSISP